MQIALEEAEQRAYIQYLDARGIIYFAVPNAVKLAPHLKTTSQRVNFWKQRKKEGVKKGVPDLVVFLPNFILFVEMKRVKNSSTSKEQKEWNTVINTYAYAFSAICKGAESAIQKTEELLRYER